jgi:hypothetical protein
MSGAFCITRFAAVSILVAASTPASGEVTSDAAVSRSTADGRVPDQSSAPPRPETPDAGAAPQLAPPPTPMPSPRLMPAPIILEPPTSGQPSQAPSGNRTRLLGEIKAQFRGAFIVNLCYNDGTLFPGGFAYYAAPQSLSHSQFFVSPSNTVVGFKLSGLTFGSAAITGAMDVNLRSPQPLVTPNSLLPQFYDVHLQVEVERWRLIVGQYLDVILPILPDTINSYPAGYLPGALGYVAPAVRVDSRFPVGESFQLVAQAAASRPTPTFQITDELFGRQAGAPDGQARIAFAVGRSDKPWERPFEIGASGHFGGRRATMISTKQDVTYTTWSLAGDLRLRLHTGTLIKGRVFMGQALGEFAAGIFQTVNTDTLLPIRARGLWLQAQQVISDRWRVTLGYGLDHANDADLGDGGRLFNEEVFGNVLWQVTRTIGFGAEGSRWWTAYHDAATTKVWRADTLFFLHF